MNRFSPYLPRVGLVILLAAVPITFVAAAETTHEHYQGTAGTPLHLKEGKKWQTHEALRQGMMRIKEALAANLSAIHQNKLAAKSYDGLSAKVSSEVATIVTNCRLEKDADAMLHLVIADLLAGAEAMLGKNEKLTRQAGAIQVVRTLDHYGHYFDHPNWQNLQE